MNDEHLHHVRALYDTQQTFRLIYLFIYCLSVLHFLLVSMEIEDSDVLLRRAGQLLDRVPSQRERCFSMGHWREERIWEKKRERKGDGVQSLAFSAPALFIWNVVTFYPTTFDFSKPPAYHINVL